MSTTPSNAPQPNPTAPEPEPEPAVPPETTVFFKPSFGITVQSSTLCVSVSAKPDSTRPCPPACG